MKFSVIAIAFAASLATASAETCDTTTLATSLTAIVTPAYNCQTATGYTLVPPSALPTAAQITAICTQCQDLITQASSVTFPTCTLTIDGTAVALDTLFNEIVGQCGSGSSSTSSEETVGTTSNTTTTAPTPTPTPAEAVTTGSTSNESTTTSASQEADTIETPSPTTTTTTTTTSSPSTTTAPSTTTSAGVSYTIAGAVATFACTVAVTLAL